MIETDVPARKMRPGERLRPGEAAERRRGARGLYWLSLAGGVLFLLFGVWMAFAFPFRWGYVAIAVGGLGGFVKARGYRRLGGDFVDPAGKRRVAVGEAIELVGWVGYLAWLALGQG
jgi:hypothetical protein